MINTALRHREVCFCQEVEIRIFKQSMSYLMKGDPNYILALQHA